MLLDTLRSRSIARALSLSFVLLQSLCNAGSFAIDSDFDIRPRAALAERDVSATPSCGFWVTTDNTTTCAQILTTYNLQASAFVALNPWEGVYDKSTTVNTTGCGGVLAYETYCVAPGVSNTISTDGSCGPNNGNAVCPGSPFGNCCSVSGWYEEKLELEHIDPNTKLLSAFCGIGNCIGGNCVNGTGWSTDGKCGIKPLQPRCGGQFGVCCSNAGWCGNGTDYCAWDNCAAGACSPPPYTSIKPTTTAAQQCQAGSCWTSLPPTGPVEGSTTTTTTTKTSTSISSTKTTSTPAATPTSVDGSCGGTSGYTCAGTTFGNCCSSSGFCGKTGVFCGEGCQTKWSSGCQTTNISSNGGRCGVISGSPTYTCVGGQFDNMCCSGSGYCGTTTGHCGSGCQRNHGRCT
ncbi:hypothetical protein AOL_s00210g228 [Orbilia oligospora ATCC 24927]|uniref:Chitin-binding type-1 domain-containing protein n=1 Tax=Arthrobotrys oligospora (strain ATCC 24927 / CBS 115.81 / DSM 1491) TaxID=756982 RepID=G1XS70_ARTOA|nr:hypothetical protein AOL_s00210g228 [Orbilia oligospora ATCC 24927]EGX44067.1 hypothetical protein AOL_s00210g228 [Orbilia oligospora ATCC 24927]